MAKPKLKVAPKPVAIYIELDPAIHRLLVQLKQRDGVPYRAAVERAVKLYAVSKGLAA